MNPHKHILFAVVALLALVSVTSLAMSNSTVGNTENENYVGTEDEGATIARSAPGRSSQGTPVTWGVFGYRSDRGMICVQAGPTPDGAAGAFTPKGFREYSPRDSIGNCIDPADMFGAMGGAAFAATAPASAELKDQASVVYGLLGPDVAGVTVTIDKTSERLPVELGRVSGMGVAASSFIAPLPPEASLPGISVTFEFKNGEKAVSTI